MACAQSILVLLRLPENASLPPRYQGVQAVFATTRLFQVGLSPETGCNATSIYVNSIAWKF